MTNSATGTITTAAGGTITVSNALNNQGLINNNGLLKVSGGTVSVGGSGVIQGTGDVDISGSGLVLLNGNNLHANNFSMGLTATLEAAANNFVLTGNFSFQQTDKVNAWNITNIAGLGPSLDMEGGPATPQTLEVGGVNLGPTPTTNFSQNFALSDLNLGNGSTVELVDQFHNAGVSDPEALYLDSLSSSGGSSVLNLNGLWCYVLNGGSPYALTDGPYLDTGIIIENAPTATPSPRPLSSDRLAFSASPSAGGGSGGSRRKRRCRGTGASASENYLTTSRGGSCTATPAPYPPEKGRGRIKGSPIPISSGAEGQRL